MALLGSMARSSSGYQKLALQVPNFVVGGASHGHVRTEGLRQLAKSIIQYADDHPDFVMPPDPFTLPSKPNKGHEAIRKLNQKKTLERLKREYDAEFGSSE